jgi:hypothetical protein
MKLFSLLLLCAAFSAPSLAQEPSPAPSSAQLRQWGEEALLQARRDFFLPQRGLYAEEWKAESGASGPAFAWGGGVLLTALVGAAQSDEKYLPWLEEYTDKLDVYWNTLGPVPGYDVLPTPKPVDRYYDDNAWVVLAFLDAHRSFGHNAGGERYLPRARKTLDYVLSGWDEKLGGGIYWRESDKASKNTCINAPAAVACYEMFRITNEARYRVWGDKLLDWTLKTLRDPTDGLMWDNINLQGKIERTKWSYNSALTFRALMLRGVLDADKGALYRVMARDMANASLRRWQAPNGGIKDGGRFAHLLVESLLALDKLENKPRYRPAVLQALSFVRQNVRDANGRYGDAWAKTLPAPLQKCELINQTSAIRAYFVASIE